MAEPVPVRVEDLDTLQIVLDSVKRHDGMKRSNPAYRRTNLEMQDIGLLGERATAHWLQQNHPNVTEIADDADSRRHGSGDLAIDVRTRHHGLEQIDRVFFEVKTCQRKWWPRYGPTLDNAQLARTTAHAYIWCVAANTWPGDEVLLMGWLPTDTIRAPGASQFVSEHNRPHRRITAPLRHMIELPEWWATLQFTPF